MFAGYYFSRAPGRPAVLDLAYWNDPWHFLHHWAVAMDSNGRVVEHGAYSYSYEQERWLTTDIVAGNADAHARAQSLSLQDVILSNCVQVANTELMRWLARHPEDLLRVHAGTFERIVAEIFTDQGYEVEIIGGWNQSDGGIDLIAVRKDTLAGQIRVGIQCKRYVRVQKVSADLIWALEGRLDKFRLHKGVVATTARFEHSALSDLSTHLWRIELRDFERLKMDLEAWGHFDRTQSGLWMPARELPDRSS